VKFSNAVTTLGVLAAIVSGVPLVAADIHKWTDADGRVHYGDSPPPGSSTKQIRTSGVGGTAPSREVQVEETVIRPYPVSGATARELGESKQLTGPVSHTTGTEGKRVWGQCHWRLDWKAEYARESGKCRIDTFSLMLGATIDFPNWTNKSAAPEALRSKWEQFSRALRAHEDGHKENGLRAANDLANRLRALPPEKDCEALNQKISDLRNRIISEYKYLDQAYDRATDHGVTQGAKLF